MALKDRELGLVDTPKTRNYPSFVLDDQTGRLRQIFDRIRRNKDARARIKETRRKGSQHAT